MLLRAGCVRSCTAGCGTCADCACQGADLYDSSCHLVEFGGADGASPEQPATVAVHLSPADVVALPDYQVSLSDGFLPTTVPCTPAPS